MAGFSLTLSTPDERADQAVPLALELVDAVRRKRARDVEACVDRADLAALAVVLAAMVDDTKPLSELLGWVQGQPRQRPRRKRERQVQPCGTHASFVRHKARGEWVDPLCRDAEREYQRERPDRRPGSRAVA